MAYTLLATKHSAQYHNYRSFRRLTSSPIIIAFLLFALISLLLGIAILLNYVSPSYQSIGWETLSLSIAGALLLRITYGATYYSSRPLTRSVVELAARGQQQEVNLVDVCDFDLIEALGSHIEPGKEVDVAKILHALFESPQAVTMLNRLQISYQQLTPLIDTVLSQALSWHQFLYDVLAYAARHNATTITVEHMVGTLLVNPLLKSFIRQNDLLERDIDFAVWWLLIWRWNREEKRKWWKEEHLLGFSGVGLSWASGFTPLVDTFSQFPRGNLWDEIILGRERYVDQLITTVSRQGDSNVLLVGQPGVGRLGVVKEFARRVRADQAHPALKGLRVVYLHVGELLAQGGQTNASQLTMISRALSEMERAGNIIAVIDGLGSILGTGDEARVNLTDVLLPFFSSLTVRVVVILSSDEYNLRLKANEELIHFFEVVQVPSVSEDATLQVLCLAAPQLEEKTGIFFPYKTLRALVEGTSGILQQIPLPERAFDVLEEAIVVAQAKGKEVLLVDDVNDLITQKVGVPVGQIRDREREYLLNLEAYMHQRMVNQNRAIAAVARAMIRARAGIRSKERPIGTFLFLGPTGVGKTETAKTLAEAYFGSEEYMVRLDMSEFSSSVGVSVLIGSPEHPVGRLTSLIEDKPFTVLLLDEFEKAHPDIHQLFLRVLDEGVLTDVRGRSISFKHTIIIATSNAGAEFIRETVASGNVPDNFDQQLRDYVLQKNIFRPELINRFDGVVMYTPLSIEHIREIAILMLKKLNKRLDAEHGITVGVTDELVNYLATNGYNPEFGARPMNRLIQNTVEYAVAQKVLRGTTQPGQQVFISTEELKEYQAAV